MAQNEQLNNIKYLEKKDFILSQENENKIPEYLKIDRQETIKFWKIRNSEDILFIKSAFNTLPWMKDYDLDKEGILKDTKKTTNEFKTSFQV